MDGLNLAVSRNSFNFIGIAVIKSGIFLTARHLCPGFGIQSMHLELLAILFLIFVMVFFSIKFRNAKAKLDEPQKAMSTEVFKSVSHGFKSLSIALVLFLILCLIVFRSLDNLIYLVFFSITFICHTYIFFKLKRKLKLSRLPGNFISLIIKANLSYLAGLLFLIVSLASRTVV
jgi:hypothetical protein